MGNTKNIELVIKNRVEEISSLAARMDELGRSWEISPELTMKINLVLEEALSNIIFYAFNDNGSHDIHVSLSLQNRKITIEISDDGIPFNPLKQKAPDITLSAEERPVGGLGIFLISQIMDEMNYERKKNKNVLSLKKIIDHEN